MLLQGETSNGTRKSRVSRGGAPRGDLRSGRGSHGNRRNNSKTNLNETDEGLEDEDMCIICANRINYAALLPCNHTVCHVCAFRQRALYEKKACLVCRTDCERMIITERIKSNYTDFSAKDFETHDEKYDIDFTTLYASNDTLGLLEYKCKVCNEVEPLFKLLSEHVKNEHHKYFCLICVNNRKAFISELKLYSFKQLQKHQAEGDEHGFLGHPECKHCRGKRFYSEDELNIHIRDNHERCHICDQLNPKTADYYKNYDTLFQHFRQDHYVCNVASCLEKKFVVFREELDLTAHMLKEHGGISSGNKVIIGATGRQYQSQLSTFSGFGEASLSAGGRNNNNSNRQNYTDDVDSYDTKTKRLEERAKHYLNYNTGDIKKFHKLNANFRSKNITARELLQAYQDLFSTKGNEDINLLLYEMSELFPELSSERMSLALLCSELLTTASREQFPALNGTSLTSTASVHSWGAGSGSRKAGGGAELFPALSKPKAPPKKLVSTNQPIRYSKVVRKVGSNQFSSVKISTTQAPSNFKPSYLDNVKKTPSVDSLPILGGSNNSSVGSSRSSSPLTVSPVVKKSSNNAALSQSKFPTLEKKLTKKPIPRVNPVILPTTWGAPLAKKEIPSNNLDFGIPIVEKKKGKQRKN